MINTTTQSDILITKPAWVSQNSDRLKSIDITERVISTIRSSKNLCNDILMMLFNMNNPFLVKCKSLIKGLAAAREDGDTMYKGWAETHSLQPEVPISF